MGATTLRGWILDLYPAPGGMVLWVKTEDPRCPGLPRSDCVRGAARPGSAVRAGGGRALRLTDTLPMAFFVGGALPGKAGGGSAALRAVW